MRLIDIVTASPRRLVVPLMGYPGVRLTRSTLKQNEFNAELHDRSIAQLAERYQPDAIFFMMDLSVEAGAIGLPVRYPLHESPSVEFHPVKNVMDLEPYRVLDPLNDARAQMYIEVMRLMATGIAALKGAYVIGPFTLAGLMMGASEIAIATVEDPDLVHTLLDFGTEVIVRYAQELVRAGADLVAILEPTATFLSPAAFTNFSGAYVSRIVQRLDTITILHICGATTRLVSAMCATGAQGLSLDAPVHFPEIARRVPPDVVLIGNVDPVRVMVNEGPEGVRDAVRQLLRDMEPYPHFILSTGCDLPPETPLENIAAFVEEGKRATRSAEQGVST
jgi:uroporphyrinogen decarboxylase